MWRNRNGTRPIVAGLVLLAATAATPTAGAIARWSPSPSSSANYLYDVSARSATDAWAVGTYVHNRTGVDRTLALHWNGSYWTRIWTPNGGAYSASLRGVVALSSANAWAVGSFLGAVEDGLVLRPLIVHWNGVGWTRVRAPLPRANSSLSAITAIGPDDLWAIGRFQRQVAPSTWETRTYAIHWDGTKWARVWAPRAPAGYDHWMRDIAATASDDVWAVGSYDDPYYTGGVMTLHWNGNGWSRSLLPKLTPYWDSDKAHSIEAISRTDVWVGGYPGLWHRDATDWTGQTIEQNGSAVAFWGVSAIAPTDVWAVTFSDGIYHFDGVSWQEEYGDTPAATLSSIGLYAVDARASDDVWAVGFDADQRTLALHWNGSRWIRT